MYRLFSLAGFKSLPLPLKIATAAMSGGGLMGIIYLVAPRYMWLFFIGLALAGLVVMAYLGFVKWNQKRRSAPLEQNILANSSSTPRGISEPASVAQLDGLRKRFEEGVEIFRSAGKNLYSLPWYLLVGEPGSGKTEAIRHCNVGFPPGLQDQLQGAGGTLNMNWWFTNHAVILDTAGRLMFEQVKPGTTNEWDEFLKLLRSSRPNCPVNGMLLVIPADSLIKDTADSLESKGGQIAKQFDHIQRVLGVRFPVFVVITKCDLINGFREFFDNLNDPQLQHQVLGWSNPAPLDETFNPADVEKHIEEVRGRLLRRRLGLLLDPVHTDDPSARRTDQVDALYSYPESLLKIMSRLRLYLEMIFVAGVWSAKPLFLRGIYFTSSMREGSVLDADLAEVLGVPVESLPDGRIWEKERAYFLRDLFLKKVFSESGLVTRASNTRQLQRRRKGAILGAVLGCVVVLVVLTFLGQKQLDQSVGRQESFWHGIQDKLVKGGKNDYKIVRKSSFGEGYQYYGDVDIKISATNISTSLGLFPIDARPWVKDQISVPWVFRPMVALTDDFDNKRREALAVLFESTFLLPTIQACAELMKEATVDTWSSDATNALAQLIRFKAHTGGWPVQARGDEEDETRLSLDGLFRYLLLTSSAAEAGQKQYRTYEVNDRNPLKRAMQWIYSDQGGQQAWPPKLLVGHIDLVSKAVDTGIKHFMEHSSGVSGGQGDLLTQLASLRDALESYQKAENDLRGFIRSFYPKNKPGKYFQVKANELVRVHDDLARTKEQVDEARRLLGPKLLNESIDARCKRAYTQIFKGALPTYDMLLAATKGRGPEHEKPQDQDGGLVADIEEFIGRYTPLQQRLRDDLDRIRDDLQTEQKAVKRSRQAQIEQVKQDLTRLEAEYLARVPRKEQLRYEVNYEGYQSAARFLEQGAGALAELSQYNAFPLSIISQRGKALTPFQVREAGKLLKKVRQISEDTLPADVDADLDRLFDITAILTIGKNKLWYDNLSKVLEALRDEPSLTCELNILSLSDQQKALKGATALIPYRWMKVYIGGQMIGDAIDTYVQMDSGAPEIVIPDGDAVTLQFYDHADVEIEQATVKFDPPWSFIRAIHEPDSEPDQSHQAWQVPLSVQDNKGKRFIYWLGLKFNRPLPALDAWPTSKTWPAKR